LDKIDYKFPVGIHAIGRLDKQSEGLLILTTNKKVTKLLFQGPIPHKRVYLVQVRNIMTDSSLDKLRNGVEIRVKGDQKYTTSKCEVNIIKDPEKISKLATPIASYIPITWLTITLTEGKFHQVRKMMSSIGHRCKRLIRISIEDLLMDDLDPGGVHEFNEVDFFEKLKILDWQNH
jgi:23S rRNA pseudouridine2457 synthase